MRGLPHIAENFKIEIFEARFFLRLLQLHLCRPQNRTPKSCHRMVRLGESCKLR